MGPLHTRATLSGLRRALLGADRFISDKGGAERIWNVYLSGEIHTDWRKQIAIGCERVNLPCRLSSANPSHEDSDDCGAIILGDEDKRNW